jgi:hypothetical protein
MGKYCRGKGFTRRESAFVGRRSRWAADLMTFVL